MTKKTIVVDSSVIVKWVSSQDEKHLEQANKILQDIRTNKVDVYTSEIAKYEVSNALLKGKGLNLAEAYISLGTVYNLPITFIQESEEIARSTYEIGQKLNITYYDAAFISTAKKYEAILITDNIKDQGKASGVKVVALKDY